MTQIFSYTDTSGQGNVIEMKEEYGLVSRSAYDLVVKERDEARLLSLKQSEMIEELTSRYPNQPLTEVSGILRFEANPIVEWLCTEKSNMTDIAIFAAENDIKDKYIRQIAQLVGYSVSGYGSLSYVDDESYEYAVSKLGKSE